MDASKVARIKACRGVYSVGDTARFFNCSKSTVHDIWQGKRHTNVPAASEPDNVISTRVDPSIIVEDGRMLLERGMKVVEAAQALGVGKTTLYDHLNESGIKPCYFG